MVIGLRPHHFLCLQGYRGYNYNQTQKTSWDNISSYLKQYPDADIVILSGKDDLCQKCPNDGKGQTSCREDNVSNLDEKVKNLIGIETGKTYKYSDILNRVKQTITSDIHENLCKTCAWWQKGMCQDTFKQDDKSSEVSLLSMTINSHKDINTNGIKYIPKAA